MGKLLLAIMFLSVAPSAILAGTVRVPADQPTIQAGLDVASPGDTVLVAFGTYYEHDIVMKSGVCLTSETGLPDCVTIDAQRQGRVLFCDTVDNTSAIVGFTLTGGLSTGQSPQGEGAGIYCWSSSPTLRACTLTGNVSSYRGGAMYCESSSPALIDCTLSGNSAEYGAGIHCWYSSSPILTGCLLSENQASVDGGGAFCYTDSSPLFTSCTFVGNSAGTGYDGGGIFCYGDSPTLIACTFSGNAARFGGGVYCDSASPTLTACVIALSGHGEGVHVDNPAMGSPLLTCCDVWGNAGGDWIGEIADQYGVNGNSSEDPLFCDVHSSDFTLCTASPCLPDNNDCAVTIGAHGEGCADCATAVHAASWSSMKAMYR